MIERLAPSLILVSPGPGRPVDFGVPDLIRYAAKLEVPVFGVCLGLQGMVEAFGGELGRARLSHARQAIDDQNIAAWAFSKACPRNSASAAIILYMRCREKLPACLEVTAESEDGVIMGVRHRDLPMEAVQFHPESILTLDGQCGLKLMENVVKVLGHIKVGTGAHSA